MRILQFSDYQILSKEERAALKKPKTKGRTLTNKELQKYDPDAYRRKMELEKEFKDTDMYRRTQEMKRQQKIMREQMLEDMYN